MSKKRSILPIFIPHLGCPHDCSFCNQKKIASETIDVTGEEVKSRIQQYLMTLPLNKREIQKEVAFYGGSFTGLREEKQKELLEPAFWAKKEGMIDDIRISTRPDYIQDENLNWLRQKGVSIIELGVQSTDNKVLELNRRGHTRKQVIQAAIQIKKHRFQLGLQMMVGLLGDSRRSILHTVRDLIYLKPDFVRVYPTLVIKDTYLEKQYREGQYHPLGLPEAVDLCKEILYQLNQHNIPIIRMGLQSTDEITYGKSVIAGPYHPAFRELVETKIFKDLIERKILQQGTKEKDSLIIYCNQVDSSKAAGYKQSNKQYFMRNYPFLKLKIQACHHIKKGEVKIKLIDSKKIGKQN